jgi:chromosomal replication initiator protein
MFTQGLGPNELDVNDIWEKAVSSLKEHYSLTPRSLSHVRKAKPLTFFGNNLFVAVPQESTRTYLETTLKEDLAAALTQVCGFDVLFGVQIDPSLDDSITGPAEPLDQDNDDLGIPKIPAVTSSHLVKPVPAPVLNPNYTFNSFVIGSSNRLAHAAALAVAEAPARSYNPLFIYGGSGLGKTHLLHAIGHYAYNLYPNMRVKYLNAESFFTDFINSVATGDGMNVFRRRYRDIDILLIDDIQFLQGKEKGLEEFFHTFEALYNSRRQIVLTSDLPPVQLTGFEERYRSRFSWGLIANVQRAELETRIAILRRKAEDQRPKLEINNEILDFIASKITTNIRELEGALTRVAAYASLNNQPVTMELADEVLKDIISDDNQVSISAPDIMEIVANYFGLSVDDLCCKSRVGALVEARSIAMFLCRRMTDLSYPDIGRLFNRDHSTVVTACKKIETQYSDSSRPATFTQIEELLGRIRQKQTKPVSA